jgi:hypothetical protein
MKLDARLTKEDLEHLLHCFLPCSIRLSGDGKLHLDAPSEVSLVAGVGLHCVCSGKLHWPVLGVHVPVGLRSLRVVLSPTVDSADDGPRLVFKLHIEHVDVALVPTVIDNRITARVNDELAKKHVELSWAFARTLSHVFGLPDALESVAALALSAKEGSVWVTEQEMGFAVLLDVDVRRRPSLAPYDPAHAGLVSSIGIGV